MIAFPSSAVCKHINCLKTPAYHESSPHGLREIYTHFSQYESMCTLQSKQIQYNCEVRSVPMHNPHRYPVIFTLRVTQAMPPTDTAHSSHTENPILDEPIMSWGGVVVSPHQHPKPQQHSLIFATFGPLDFSQRTKTPRGADHANLYCIRLHQCANHL